MTHTYRVTGMTCAHCVANVRKALLSLPDVTDAEVSLPGQAIVRMRKHVPLEELQKAVGASGHYSIAEADVHHDLHAHK